MRNESQQGSQSPSQRLELYDPLLAHFGVVLVTDKTFISLSASDTLPQCIKGGVKLRYLSCSSHASVATQPPVFTHSSLEASP